jgi:diguanylate cyclase (GGDEF)-like protein
MLTTDYLTGICNRSRFFEIGERECLRALRYAQPLGLIAMDLDHFKLVNDTYGHAAGDEVLKSFTKACAALLRPSDTFARLGGEEFVVLLPSTTLAGAGELAERLRAAIAAATVLLSGNVLRVTASLGCSELNSEVRNLQALIAAADKALYIAKESGRDHVTLAVPDKAVAEA